MPSPSFWSDPADPGSAERRQGEPAPAPPALCAWCGEPATERSVWVTGRQVRHDLPLCKFCGSAVAIGDYSITITVMDRKRTLRGQDLAGRDGHAHW